VLWDKKAGPGLFTLSVFVFSVWSKQSTKFFVSQESNNSTVSHAEMSLVQQTPIRNLCKFFLTVANEI